jgi:hypothetical protein
MIKPAPTGYSALEARSLFDRDPVGALRKPLFMTATLRRRALKKKPEKERSCEKAGKGSAIPAISSFVLHDGNDRGDN